MIELLDFQLRGEPKNPLKLAEGVLVLACLRI